VKVRHEKKKRMTPSVHNSKKVQQQQPRSIGSLNPDSLFVTSLKEFNYYLYRAQSTSSKIHLDILLDESMPAKYFTIGCSILLLAMMLVVVCRETYTFDCSSGLFSTTKEVRDKRARSEVASIKERTTSSGATITNSAPRCSLNRSGTTINEQRFALLARLLLVVAPI